MLYYAWQGRAGKRGFRLIMYTALLIVVLITWIRICGGLKNPRHGQ